MNDGIGQISVTECMFIVYIRNGILEKIFLQES